MLPEGGGNAAQMSASGVGPRSANTRETNFISRGCRRRVWQILSTTRAKNLHKRVNSYLSLCNTFLVRCLVSSV